MSTNEFPDELTLDTDNDSNLVRDLRAALRAKNTELGKVNQKLETFEKQSRTSSLSDLLTAAGVNTKVSAFYPADAEVSKEAVEKWLADYGDVFGATPKPVESEAGEPAAEVEEPAEGGLSEEDAAGFAAAQQVSTNALTAVVTGTDQIRRVMQEAKGLPPEEGRNLLKKHGLVT